MTDALAPPPYIGVFDLFTIGIGPSSSHTVGPMRAAADFVARLGDELTAATGLAVTLYGSLAATGEGHGTFAAVLLGLEGCRPDDIRADEVAARTARIERDGTVVLAGGPAVPFRTSDIVREPFTVLERHTNGIRFAVTDAEGAQIASALYFSVGGGFIVRDGAAPTTADATAVPYPFASADELLTLCRREGLSIAEVVRRNECTRRTDDAVDAGILAIRDAMHECVAAGIASSGVLPGGLDVRRRAPGWHDRLRAEDPDRDPRFWQEWVNLVALAVNEENAAGGRVVTAPTNGAAGIIPAVLHYAEQYSPAAGTGSRDDIAIEFLLTAAAIGALYKTRASISGAEVGCQGEVGSASSMAAGALAAVLGGTPEQVENAAEIAMEHNLGLTCDPVGGLVQIPCIERNAIAAGKAINAAKMALWGDGTHRVSLDTVIETMRQTGRDMSDKYKETAMGGLAVNVVEC
ncbi:L-serine ammonia-lyase [Microbacterium telephonicum]|uniref:L-serine dehydratase n=1 Tax=Microbacterium telephonicum TaxID=1714841 RepID=A0A498C078_9MICO|nr:L-serine ammonia-lyase [Microbacterium telephonicum]RLK49062.1 L-serine dehydratase [Microbacterium telephonicum]